MQLSTISLALTRLGGAGAFDPSSLFAGGTVAGAWYDPSDLTTMFTTSAGTTPVAMPGQGSAVSVGLMLDKSQGLVLGSELANAATQTLATATGTQSGAGWNITATGSFAILSQPSIIAAGKWYKYTVSWSGNTNGRTIRFLAGGNGGSNSPFSFGTSASGTGTVIVSGGTQNTSAYFQINDSVNGDTFYLEITSVRELPGNHAIAFNDTTARPELRARVNLLTYSEEFDNAAWTGSVAVSANTTVAPNGTATADTITVASTGTYRVRRRSPAGLLANVQFVLSVSAKAGVTNWISLRFWDTAPGVAAWFNLATGAVGTVQAGCTASISDQGNGWYRCSITRTVGSSIAFNELDIGVTDGDNTDTGTTGASVILWGADLRPANIGANVPAYQRIADANTYDTSGFPLYLRFDGIDDSMYTPANLDLSGTDKVAVFAGVRKLSDAGIQVVAQTYDSTSPNANTFNVFAPAHNLAGFGTGLTQTNADFAYYGTSTPAAPASAVWTSQFDRAASGVTNKIQARLNGAIASLSVASSGGTIGTGNFGARPLYIGYSNVPSRFLNGNIYSLIVVGSAVSAGNISATEQWVAGRTGISIP